MSLKMKYLERSNLRLKFSWLAPNILCMLPIYILSSKSKHLFPSLVNHALLDAFPVSAVGPWIFIHQHCWLYSTFPHLPLLPLQGLDVFLAASATRGMPGVFFLSVKKGFILLFLKLSGHIHMVYVQMHMHMHVISLGEQKKKSC